ncbi:hypothetical protein R6Q59_023831 [Mikania micrantha]
MYNILILANAGVVFLTLCHHFDKDARLLSSFHSFHTHILTIKLFSLALRLPKVQDLLQTHNIGGFRYPEDLTRDLTRKSNNNRDTTTTRSKGNYSMHKQSFVI